jgi:TetR/AcrR family transcriptional regulator, tetracycline repressor protein
MTTPPPEGADRSPLTRDRILDAAVAIVDEHGIEGLSMRKLGTALGVEAMSLYNHIPNKAALLDGVLERVVSEINIPDDGSTWDERLRQMTTSFRSIALSHPRCVPLFAMRPFNSLPALDVVEAVFELLAEAGFSTEEAFRALRAMSAYAVGFTISEALEIIGEGADRPPVRFIDPESTEENFPRTIEAAPVMLKDDSDLQFEFGVDLLLSGLKEKLAEIKKRSGATP